MEEGELYEGKYCNSDDVLNLCGEMSDDATLGLLKTAIDNSEGLIDSKLRGSYVLIPTDIPSSLKTCAIYLATSDVLLSLYTGEELPTQYDIYWNKAHELLEEYIVEMQNIGQDIDGTNNRILVKHSNSPTYNERHRNGRNREHY